MISAREVWPTLPWRVRFLRRHVLPWRWGVLASSCLVVALLFSPLCPSVAAQDLAELEERAVRAAVEQVAPSVVRIETVGGLEQVGNVLLGEGPTTGLVVSSDGYIISSTFNFLKLPSSILVALPGGRRAPARVVARDLSRHLVLLQVTSPTPLPVPPAVPRGEIRVGQWAIAVGRTVNPDKPNVSVGIVSARHRIWGKAIQTDAKISPSNYGGPLIDLQGRVLGILAPLSPTSQNELAGAEWYDGGIGFAVPLIEINERLARMKQGEDQHPGLLGVTLKAGDIYTQPADISACHPKSPAYRTGLRAGDRIISVNGHPIERQAQLRHAMGPLYAGDRVQLQIQRGTERRELAVELARDIEPYEQPYLGVLPERGQPAEPAGMAVRYVFPDSPAARAGLRVGDRIVKFTAQGVAHAAALREALGAFEPDQEVSLVVVRAGKEQSLSLKLARLPASFPPAEAASAVAPAGKPAEFKPAGVSTIKLPEEPNDIAAYIPASYRPEKPHGLVVVLPVPGEFKEEAFVLQWSAAAERFGLIVVAPQARMPNAWLPTEATLVRKVVDHLVGKYHIDRTRVVAFGSQAGGGMAYLAAFGLRDLIRGVVTVDAAIPQLIVRPPDNDPIERLGVVALTFAGAEIKTRVQQNVELLRELKYPVIFQELPGESRSLDDDTREAVLRWIDTLDQL